MISSRRRTTARTREEPSSDKPELIWLRQEPSAARAAYRRSEIADVALELAETLGFEAASMRRVAQEPGAGAMTLCSELTAPLR